MNKKELLDKVKSLNGLSTEEKAYLINLVNTKKKYGLVWEDKPEEVEEKLRTHLPVLKEVKAIINDTETEKHPNHILIEGDNLHALTALTFTHENKIDLIYIDPPYNTGDKDFRYHDAFKDDSVFIDKDHPFRHSTWLSFMDKRLKIALTLLSETGVIVCHIDENEFDNLSILSKEIFGENNDLGVIVWNKKNPKGDSKGVANMHEYIICFAKNKNEFLQLNETLKRNKANASQMIAKAKTLFRKKGKTQVPEDVKSVLKPFDFPDKLISKFEITYDIKLINKEFKSWVAIQDFSKGEKMYKYIDNEGKPYRGVSMAWPNKKKAPDNYFIPLKHPITSKDCPIPGKGWRNPPLTMTRLLGKDQIIINPDSSILQGEILFGKDHKKQPERKYKLEENLKENTSSILEYGGSDDNFLSSLEINFPYVKPINVTKYLISAIHPKPKYMLDFFAGTGSSFHGVMALNDELEIGIKSISITNNEDGIADDCFKRSNAVINGYDDVKGLKNNNLRYYKCDFVDSAKSEYNRRLLTKASVELLNIKENCYDEKTTELGLKVAEVRIFTSNTMYLIIIFHSRNMQNSIEAVTKIIEEIPEGETIKLYGFSPEKETLREEFIEVANRIEAIPLPEAIYNAYRNTYRTIGLSK
jgi:adenine-specific DNA-methyltransferase